MVIASTHVAFQHAERFALNRHWHRLLQFITGSAILPHGGFGGFNPQLNIGNPMVAGLPTAHTCFNNLMLPPYESMKELHRKLITAIYDGAEGFWIA